MLSVLGVPPAATKHAEADRRSCTRGCSRAATRDAPGQCEAVTVGACGARARRFVRPSVVNNFELGASAIAEGLVIFPAAITVAPIDTQVEAIGGLIAPTLISITPVREVRLRTGLGATPVGTAVVLAPPGGNGTAPAAAPGASAAPAAPAAPNGESDDGTAVTGAGRAAGVGG